MKKERSLNQHIAFAVSASWFSRFVTISLTLVLIPILFNKLGQEELGFWFMLGQSGAFLNLMDLGVTSTITRRFALAKGKSGHHPDVKLNEISRRKIADLMASSKIIYHFLTIGIFLIAWVTGFLFIGQIELQQLDYQTIWIAWTIMCISHAVGVWAMMWTCLLQGLGYMAWDSLLWTFINVFTLCIQIVVVFMGGGLIALAVVAVMGALATRVATFLVVRKKQPELFAITGHWNGKQVRSMLSPAFKSWQTELGIFLILKTDQYFIAYFQGAENIPVYHAAYQIVLNLHTLAISFAKASSVFISQLWESGEITKAQQVVQRNLRLGLSLMLCGVASLILVGENVISLWLGKGHFVGYSVLIVFCIMLILDSQYMMITTASRATEDEAFAPWLIAAGLLNLLFTFLLIKPFGLLGVALATLLAQSLTINWYGVYRGLQRLQMNFGNHLKQVLMPSATVFLISIFFGWIMLNTLPASSGDIATVITGLTSTGIVLMGAWWFLVLDRSLHKRIIDSIVLIFRINKKKH
jgi:O-antigen/teichoic acid export membrane protein